jgi:multicomponent Na+:H+ antiporter subunit D
MFFMAAFAIKAALFPMFFWLPASYHTPPAAIGAFFAGSLTKLGIYALIRVFTLIFTQNTGYTSTLFLFIAGFTMMTGVLGAIPERDLRRLLSFQVVSHIGYVVMGLALFTPLALAGAVYYLIHEVIAKTNLFLVSGLIARLRGTNNLDRLGGLYITRPGLSAVFLILAFSLSGIPPLSGFPAKVLLVRAGFEEHQYTISGIALLVSVLTLYSMGKAWTDAFWKPADDAVDDQRRLSVRMWGPCAGLALITIAIGLAAGPVFRLAERAATQLLAPNEYIQAVLGEP